MTLVTAILSITPSPSASSAGWPSIATPTVPTTSAGIAVADVEVNAPFASGPVAGVPPLIVSGLMLIGCAGVPVVAVALGLPLFFDSGR